MRYLFDYWETIKKEIVGKDIFLFLDYDGTLTSISDTPDKAVISNEIKKLLKRLSEYNRLRLAIISGRALSDIKRIIGIKNIFYGGNHGLEIEGPKIKFVMKVNPELIIILRNIKEELEDKLSKISGIFVEDKGLTLSTHYRLVKKNDFPLVKKIFNKIVKSYLLKEKIRINSGKKIFEVKPSLNWDKGKAVLWLLKKEKSRLDRGKILPLYIGDDNTDEDAFKALRNKGITIFVGEKAESYAEYYLRDILEVQSFLNEIIKLT